MRKFTLTLALVALLIIISTAVVSAAGVNWDGDPSFPIEDHPPLWGHVVAGWIGDGPPHAEYSWKVKERDDRLALKGCARKDGDGRPLFLRVWFSEDQDGRPIVQKKAVGRADNKWICATVTMRVDHEDDGDHDDD